MTEICRQHCLVRLVVVVLTSSVAAGYENAYDLAERRNQYGDDPNNRYYESSERYYNRYQDRDRYSTHNQRPTSVYSSLRPAEDPGFVITRRTSSVGNGYDNLGNSGLNSRLRQDWNRFSEPRRHEPFTDTRRFDESRRWNTNRNDVFLGDRRPLSETFRTRGRFDDRRGGDPFRSVDSLNDRPPIDPIRDVNSFEDRPALDLSRNPDSLDDRRTIDAFREAAPNRRIDDRAEGTLEHRVVDLPRRSHISESFEVNPRPRTTIHRRSDSPDFYRKDYFGHGHRGSPGEKSAGFESKNSDNNYQSAAGEKENSGVSAVGSYVTSNEDNNQKKLDSGFNENKEGAKLDVANKEKIGETTRFDKNGGNKSTVRSNRVSKKGHATKGFATHHHKDETGNSTTFFDESSDAGGQSDYQDLEDEFGTRRTMEVLNGKEDGRFFQENGGRSGTFGSGLKKDNKKVEKDIVSKDDRFNKEERFGDGQDHVDRGFKTASEYLGGGLKENKDDIDLRSKTALAMAASQKDKVQAQTGMDRIYLMFSTDEFGEPSPEIVNISHVMMMSMLVGGAIGGFVRSKTAFLDFIERNDASSFGSHFEAKQKLQDKVTMGFGRGAWQWAWRLSGFTGAYTLVSTSVSVYRGESGILEHVIGGLVTGMLYKANLGIRGLVVGGCLGTVLGTFSGLSIWAILQLTGTTMDDVRSTNYWLKKSRDDSFQGAVEEYLARKEPAIVNKYDAKVGREVLLESIKLEETKAQPVAK